MLKIFKDIQNKPIKDLYLYLIQNDIHTSLKHIVETEWMQAIEDEERIRTGGMQVQIEKQQEKIRIVISSYDFSCVLIYFFDEQHYCFTSEESKPEKTCYRSAEHHHMFTDLIVEHQETLTTGITYKSETKTLPKEQAKDLVRRDCIRLIEEHIHPITRWVWKN